MEGMINTALRRWDCRHFVSWYINLYNDFWQIFRKSGKSIFAIIKCKRYGKFVPFQEVNELSERSRYVVDLGIQSGISRSSFPSQFNWCLDINNILESELWSDYKALMFPLTGIFKRASQTPTYNDPEMAFPFRNSTCFLSGSLRHQHISRIIAEQLEFGRPSPRICIHKCYNITL